MPSHYAQLTDPYLDGHPDALPFYEERMRMGGPGEQIWALDGALAFNRQPGVAGERAWQLIEAALDSDYPEVRGRALGRLRWMKHPVARKAYEGLLNSSDEAMRHTAAAHLAMAEDLSLADWLARAAEDLTQARYLAAQDIVRELEQTWHTSKGAVPDAAWNSISAGDREAFSATLRAWAGWAQENPQVSDGYFRQPGVVDMEESH